MTDYEYWLSLDGDTRSELEAVSDKNELEDRFYKNLEFGTGGMRGIMGAGPNRMNIYTVAKATKGLADYLNASDKDNSVVIAYDSRNNSKRFALIAAGVLAKENIKVGVFDTLMPTPVLSFAVRYLGYTAGIVITASHNPKEYNGYKVYDAHGCQLTPQYADRLIQFVNAVPIDDITYVKQYNFTNINDGEKVNAMSDTVLTEFIEACKALSLYSNNTDLKIVYTPLHGTGNLPVRQILADYDVTVVKEQELPDGNFSTVRSPNPEEKDALNLAVKTAERIGADIVIGTDPDCDRVGIAVRHNGEYRLMTGNQVGALLTNFIVNNRELPQNAAIVKTIVTSSLGAAIAKKHGCKVFETLTGFKYIGEKICQWEKSGQYSFVFGYEESYGYFAGTHARDKDAVSTSLLIAEAAAYHKAHGETLVDALNKLYAEYGFYYDCLETVVLKGKDGTARIKSAMELLRKNAETLFDNLDSVIDYQTGVDDLPRENVLKLNFSDGSWAAIRPSGTEPKLKMYYSVRAENEVAAVSKQQFVSRTLHSNIM